MFAARERQRTTGRVRGLQKQLQASRLRLQIIGLRQKDTSRPEYLKSGSKHSWAAIRRAQTALGVEVTKEGLKGGWTWRLPPG